MLAMQHCLPVDEDTGHDQGEPAADSGCRTEQRHQAGGQQSRTDSHHDQGDHAKTTNGDTGSAASGIVIAASSARFAATAPSIFSPGRFDSFR